MLSSVIDTTTPEMKGEICSSVPDPVWGPIGKEVYERTYSREKANGCNETWEETIQRTINGNCNLVPSRFIETGEREALFNLFYFMKSLPAGRHLWVSGVPGRQFVNNCVGGTTKVLTRIGWKPIKELVGTSPEIVTEEGRWVTAPFKSFGVQPLMRLVYKDAHNKETYEVFPTPEHEWVVEDSHKTRTKIQTQYLKPGMRLSVVTARSNGLEYLSPQGIQHGIVFGDGCSTEHDCHIDLIGESYTNLIQYFPNNRANDLPNVKQPAAHVGGMPSYYKKLPSLEENRPYLLGFLAGWIAADGWVKETVLSLGNKSKETLEYARSIAAICGIRTTRPYLMRDTNPFDGSKAEMWSVNFFSCDRSDKLVIREDHKQKHKLSCSPRSQKYCIVDTIESTELAEEVFCAEVPETHTFVIDGCVLTGNCWNAHWSDDFARHFTFTFSRLMEGGGVGANYSNKYIKHYKPFKRTVNLHFVCSLDHKDYKDFENLISTEYSPNWTGSHVITDDREGWVLALELLLKAYYSDGEEPVTIVFDASIVRPKGSRIRGFGGSASGPAALLLMLRNICDLLNSYLGQKPNSIICMEIDHQIASCVVAGNVRRSARMSMKHWMDSDIWEFLVCKNGARNHWSTNISVVIDNKFFRAIKRNDEHALKVLDAVAEGMLHNGEPGIYNIDKASEGEPFEAFTTNPCGEIAFSSPWEQCNLGHVNLGAFVGDQSGLYKAMRLMSRFLLRATYADIPDTEARKVVDCNRRIGVGFFGYHEWVILQGIKYSDSHTSKEIRRQLAKCYEIVRKEARDYAFELRIPEPIKVTAVAPTGTIAKLPGVSEGAQSIFAPFFKKRVRYSTTDPKSITALAEFESKGFSIEDDAYSANTKTVTFHVKDPLVDKVEKAGLSVDLVEGAYDIHLQDLLAVQAMVQECYADNAVSFTANIVEKNYTKDDIIEALKIYGPRLKGATVFPDFSNMVQLPYEPLTKEEWEKNQTLFSVGQAENDCETKGMCPIK